MRSIPRVVFAGTLAPLISDTLGLGTVSVGPPYFNPSVSKSEMGATNCFREFFMRRAVS